MNTYRFCPLCGRRLSRITRDNHHYMKCNTCHWHYYKNPLPAVASFVKNEKEEILLVKRGVTPSKGSWALSSGFIEQNEMPEEAALRELYEETGFDGKIRRLIGAYNELTKIYGCVLVLGFDIEIIGGKLKASSDTLDARFFPVKSLPSIPFKSHRKIIYDGLDKRVVDDDYMVTVLKSKITEAIVTGTVLHYRGSMGIDRKIMDAAGLQRGEKVQVLNYDNGERLETYVIEEKAWSGRFILYGPASLKGKVGDKLCILSYAQVRKRIAWQISPKIVILGRNNKIKK